MKRYNPNTPYGRRRNRDTAQQRINSYTPKQKAQYNCCLAIVVGGIIGITFLIQLLKRM